MKKTFFTFLILSLGISANAEYITNCKVERLSGEVLRQKTINLPKMGSPGVHFEGLYDVGSAYYGFSLPFDLNLSNAGIYKGHPSGGGTMFDISLQGDISKSPLSMTDLIEDIKISCTR